jgi:uncharacterized membrane protein YgcG
MTRFSSSHLPNLFALACGVWLTMSCNNANCEHLRDELFAKKTTWQECVRDEDCIKVGGNGKDCTGILSCDFAVNRVYRDAAERRVASLPQESVDCTECSTPNCVAGDIAMCEPVTHQCIIVTGILDDGTGGNGSPEASGGSGTGGSGSGGSGSGGSPQRSETGGTSEMPPGADGGAVF